MFGGTGRRMLVRGRGRVRERYEEKERRGHAEREPIRREHPAVGRWPGSDGPVRVQSALPEGDDGGARDQLDRVQRDEDGLAGIVQPRDPPDRRAEGRGGWVELERRTDPREELADQREVPICLPRSIPGYEQRSAVRSGVHSLAGGIAT